MSERQAPMEDMDEAKLAVLDLLYAEGGAETELSAEQLSDLGEFREMRSLFAQLEEAEPPARISAQLLATAAAGHGPVRRRAAAAREERGGIWNWLMRPFITNPAFAAAASLVVLVGIAGALYVGGGLKSEEGAQVSVQADRAAEKPAVVTDKPAAVTETLGGESQPAKMEAKEEAEGEGNLDLDDLAGGYRADNLPKQKPKGTAGRTAPPAADEKAAAPRERRAARTIAPRGNKDSRAPGDSWKTPDSEPSPEDDGVAGGADAPSNDTPATVAKPEPARPSTKKGESSSEAERLTIAALQAAKRGDCARALSLAARVRKQSAKLYDERLAGDSAIRACKNPRQRTGTSKRRK